MSASAQTTNNTADPAVVPTSVEQLSDSNSTVEKNEEASDYTSRVPSNDDSDPEALQKNKDVYTKSWTKKWIIVAYGILIFTAFVENFANDSTKSLDSYATSEFSAHSLISTAAVVYKISAICAYPILAKIADLLGRGEGFGISVFLYTMAYVLYAACQNVQTYICAEIFFAVGRNGYRVFQQIFIADTTNLINRGILSQLPAALAAVPSLYAGSYVQDAFLEHSTWRWGYGSFAIILGASVIPLTLCMFALDRKAKINGEKRIIKIFQNLPEGSIWNKIYHVVFVELDLPGGALLVTGFALFFVPLTLTGKSSSYRWHEGRLIAMIVIGFVIFCCFLVWNFSFKTRPIVGRKSFVPAQSFKNKTVVIILLMLALDLCENSSFATYFSTVLQVGGYYTAGQATRIDNSKKVTVDIAAILCGLAMKYTKRSKIYVLIGVPILVLGHGLLVWFMNREDIMERTILLYVMEIFIGFGRGLYQSSLQVTIQAITGVEGVAMSTAFFMAFQSIGSLIGTCLAGGIWNSVLLSKLAKHLPDDQKSNAKKIYNSITVAKSYKKGTETRTAISLAYRETIQTIGYAGLGIIAPMLILMFFVREVKLTDKHDAFGAEGVDMLDGSNSVSEGETDLKEKEEETHHVQLNTEKRTWKNFWRV